MKTSPFLFNFENHQSGFEIHACGFDSIFICLLFLKPHLFFQNHSLWSQNNKCGFEIPDVVDEKICSYPGLMFSIVLCQFKK
jgi:hypothetical protein